MALDCEWFCHARTSANPDTAASDTIGIHFENEYFDKSSPVFASWV